MHQAKKPAFRLIGITDDSALSRDGQQLDTLLANGLDYLYWRNLSDEMPLPPVATVYQDRCLVAASSPESVRSPFRWHLKEKDRQRLFAVDGLVSEKPFSTSIHHLSEWLDMAGRVEMVFYSPLLPSISKPGYGPAVSLKTVACQVAAMREQHPNLPLLIGLGGITAQTVAQVQQAGFDGAALMGTLWKVPDPLAALQEVRAAVYP
ncbi:thiamine phosphate synthase [Spirosoma sp. KUDC1026]|uniref:thiamine phosphate synthase n=1 Tax=Spirosoma sp. KUDC1026 TaxID=2745947 RepID=UPI00159BDFA5|nr:thiamine phosphate synthase [Spirosoma sp. KUDC1026]QKZ14753.1 thiamine phosphate synthase [Spirosoma sp. KUDC1026]